MSELTGKTVASTYRDILQMGNSNNGIDTTLRWIQDGEGHECGVGISTTAVHLKGDTSVEIEGDITTRGDIKPSDDNTYDIGSPTRQVKDVHVNGSVYVNTEQLSVDPSTRRLTYVMTGGNSESVDAIVVQSYDTTDGEPNTLSNKPQLSVKTLTTEISACYTGTTPDVNANHVNLPAGYLGQIKTIIGAVESGPVNIHSTDMVDMTKITLPGGGGTGVAETMVSVMLQYTSTGWFLLNKSSELITTS
jgi:hypothetical protein